jgi:hypothetical protein
MAVEPLYNSSKEELLKKVRIETADDEQTLALVDSVIQEVRVGFFTFLTRERAQEVAAYPLVENPSTDEEVLKTTAAVTEVNWVTYLLALRLPVIYMSNESGTRDSWNEEPLTRDSASIREFLSELKKAKDAGLGFLVVPTDANAGSIKSSLNGPDTPWLIGEHFAGLTRGWYA